MNYVLLSLDVISLFTNISNELVLIGLEKRWELIKNNTSIPKKSFLNAVIFILNSTFFKFNNKFYNQVSGTPIGFSISPIIANIVMVDLEREILPSFDFVIPWYFRYVDDTILCVPQDKADIVLCKFNSYNPRLQFTYKIESNNTLSFLDIKLMKVANEHIITNWYRKNTYSGRFLNFLSCHPFNQKLAVIKNLTDQAILLSHQSFHKENLILIKQLLLLNNYPINLIKKQIAKRITYLNNNRDRNLSYNQKPDSNNKYITIPYFG